MKIGIVWLPNIGKSTLFNALTKSYSAPAENFPFCTIEPNIGIVDVKDPRIDKLSELSNTKKTVHANIEFVDIAGLVRGAGKGEWLGNKFLAHIREVDTIVQVLRYFNESDVNHVEWSIDPIRDAEIINWELAFADLEQIDRHLPGLIKKAQKAGDKEAKALSEILSKANETLLNGKMLNELDLDEKEKKLIKAYNFLTIKPIIYALNVSQEDIPRAAEIKKEFEEKLGASVSIVCAKLESEMMEFSNEEREEFIKELLEIDQAEHIPTLDDLIALAFRTVGLMYYFTTWEKETRAWTIPVWSTAPQAAGAIHTDFERWFIKAEVVAYEDLITLGSWARVKEKWLLKLQGKDYIVKDWDVMVFKFNV